MLLIALGYESHSHDAHLNVIDGKINETILAASDLGPDPLESWLEGRKEA